jgi:Skp family chaperone for outer membrane proteins
MTHPSPSTSARTNQWLFGVLCCVLGGLFALPAPAHALTIGYVNLRYAVRNVKDGKRARKRLKGLRAKYQRQLNGERKKLEKARKLYLKRRSLLRGRAKQREERKLQKMILSVQTKYRRLMKQLALQERREMADNLQKMRAVLQTIIRDKGIKLMLEKGGSSLLYAPKKLDHTKELIRRYERAFSKKGKRGKKRRKRR